MQNVSKKFTKLPHRTTTYKIVGNSLTSIKKQKQNKNGPLIPVISVLPLDECGKSAIVTAERTTWFAGLPAREVGENEFCRLFCSPGQGITKKL
jgi:hypothetical protein